MEAVSRLDPDPASPARGLCSSVAFSDSALPRAGWTGTSCGPSAPPPTSCLPWPPSSGHLAQWTPLSSPPLTLSWLLDSR